MTNLEKILENIRTEAKEYEIKKGENTHKEAVAILEAARKEAEIQAEQIINDANINAEKVVEKIKAETDLEKRKILLKAKHDLIENVISSAKKYLLNMPCEEYFHVMLEFIKKIAQPNKEYVLIMSSKDQSRIPEDFLNSLNKLSQSNNCKINLCNEPANISAGFILECHGIEQNYSIDAIFEQCREDIFDILKDFLFVRK